MEPQARQVSSTFSRLQKPLGGFAVLQVRRGVAIAAGQALHLSRQICAVLRIPRPDP